MKKINTVPTSQCGIEISEYGKSDKINIWMDKSGAYGTFGQMEFKIKKDFNDMKLVKTGDKLDVYFNGKLMGSGSIENIPEGSFYILQTEGSGSDKAVIQYYNIRYEVTNIVTAPLTAEAPSTDMIVKIPDVNFKAALIAAGIDKNNDGEIQKTSEAMLVTQINVHDKKVASLDGIQHYENLTVLNCATNSITTLDITKNSKLKTLFCKGNKLTVLDIFKNSLLTSIVCSSNQLTTLNISDNKFLTTIECASNLLMTLNVADQKNLKWLDCRWNKLTTLNVTGCLKLATLKCEDNLINQIVYSAELNVDPEDKEWSKDKTAVFVINRE